jgi:hypothetical protein
MGGSKTTQKTSSNQTTNQNQTQTAAPPSWTMPGLQQAADAVTAAMGQIPSAHYTGPTTATYNPADIAAIQAAWGNTAANAQGLAGWEQSTVLPQLSALAAGPSWTTSLPGQTTVNAAPMQDATAAINASMYPIMHELTTSILPGITNSALASGAYTSDRALGVVPTEAIANATESAQRTGATLGYQAYEDWATRMQQAQEQSIQNAQQNYSLETARTLQAQAEQLQALGMTPDMINSILHTQASSGDLLNMAAQLGLTADQATINNAMGMDQYASQSPFLGLDTASQLLTQLSGGWGTTASTGTANTQGTSTTTTQQQSPLAMQLLQGALGIGSMAMGIPGAGGALSGMLGLGGAAGASAGAAANMFAAPATFPGMTPGQYLGVG